MSIDAKIKDLNTAHFLLNDKPTPEKKKEYEEYIDSLHVDIINEFGKLEKLKRYVVDYIQANSVGESIMKDRFHIKTLIELTQ